MKRYQKETPAATTTKKEEIDSVKDFNENCKNHIDTKEKNIWLC